ncbi:DNA helicase UvrD [Candidatus Pacearchaeota archaeon]|nr:DNA helicase UvrD [Candidatus Pacearchaeota archaeon]
MEKGKEVIADLHIHSKYSRATSIYLDIENLVKYSRVKGLGMLGTGDFTHPKWLAELKLKLKEKDTGSGIYYHNDFPFVLSSELSLIYTKERGRRIHLVLLAPSFEIVEQINAFLLTKGRLDYDGRPIFGFSCELLVDEMLNISKEIEIIPAHVFTPWFGIFGSMSGFNSLKEAFSDKVSKIHAIETGLSSDPEMNWRLSELNEKSIVSFSDAHSFHPFRLGREATIFNNISRYNEIIKQIRENTIAGTVETSPLYGKYHYDGHRLCKFSCSPAETKKINGICPVCHKPLTIGVENRVEELADKPLGFKPASAKPFYTLLPLQEIISMVKASTLTSKKVYQIYYQLIEKFGSEFNILLHADKEKLAREADEKLVEAILLNRQGRIKVKAGYDGVYGEAMLAERQEKLF